MAYHSCKKHLEDEWWLKKQLEFDKLQATTIFIHQSGSLYLGYRDSEQIDISRVVLTVEQCVLSRAVTPRLCSVAISIGNKAAHPPDLPIGCCLLMALSPSLLSPGNQHTLHCDEQTWCPEEESYWLSSSSRSKLFLSGGTSQHAYSTERIDIICITNGHGISFSDSLCFPLVPSWCWSVWFIREMSWQLLEGLPWHSVHSCGLSVTTIWSLTFTSSVIIRSRFCQILCYMT